MIKGEEYVRGLLTKELQVYADRFPGGVNLPLIIQSTVEYLAAQQHQQQQQQQYGFAPSVMPF